MSNRKIGFHFVRLLGCVNELTNAYADQQSTQPLNGRSTINDVESMKGRRQRTIFINNA